MAWRPPTARDRLNFAKGAVLVSNSVVPPGAAAPGLSRRGWATLLVLSAVVFLDALDVSMVGVALPSIRTNLHMSTSSLQWVVSAYLLGYGGVLPPPGRPPPPPPRPPLLPPPLP